MPAARIVISEVAPQVDCGRWPAKACVGDRVAVAATIVRDGHDPLRAVVRHRRGRARWREEPLRFLGNDRFAGSFAVDAVGRWQFEIEAWVDRHAAWLDEHDRKVAAGQTDLAGELAEGEALFGAGDAGGVARRGRRARVGATGTAPRAATRSPSRSSGSGRARAPGTSSFPARGAGSGASPRWCPRSPSTASTSSTSRRSTRSASRTARGGTTRNGLPRATSAARGRSAPPRAATTRSTRRSGTRTISPALVEALRAHGMELALDLALQASPDHPWLREHPEWFQHRPDGSLKYAENPPKRYQDIHNFDWDTTDRKGLWEAFRAVVLRWCEARRHGVPRRQPAHEADPVLGVADRRGPQAPSRDGVPLRGVHAAGADDAPREGGLLAVLHVLHLEEHEARARRARRAAARVVPVPAAEPLAEHARTSSTRRSSRAGAPRSSAGSCSPRPSRRATASTRATSAARTSPCGPAARSTSTRRSTRCATAALDGPLLPLVRRLNEIRRAHPALTGAGLERLTWLETESEHLLGYAQRARRRRRARGRQPRPVRDPRGRLRRPGGARPARAVRRRRCADAARRYAWGARNYVRLGPGRAHVMRCRDEQRRARQAPHWQGSCDRERAPSAAGISAGSLRDPLADSRRALVRVPAGLVQDRRLLRAAHARVLRLLRRRHRGLPRAPPEARLPGVARRRLHLAPAVLSLAAARRRLRRRGLPERRAASSAPSTSSRRSSRRRTSGGCA